MENGPVEDVFPIEHGDFPLPCWFTGGYRFISCCSRVFSISSWESFGEMVGLMTPPPQKSCRSLSSQHFCMSRLHKSILVKVRYKVGWVLFRWLKVGCFLKVYLKHLGYFTLNLGYGVRLIIFFVYSRCPQIQLPFAALVEREFDW